MSLWSWLQGCESNNTTFNKDEYLKDMKSGMSINKAIKKSRSGAYMNKSISFKNASGNIK